MKISVLSFVVVVCLLSMADNNVTEVGKIGAIMEWLSKHIKCCDKINCKIEDCQVMPYNKCRCIRTNIVTH